MVITSGDQRTTTPSDPALKTALPKDNSLAKRLVARWKELKAIRMPYEYYWQEVNDLVRPNTQAFQQSFTQGAPRTRKIYDGTAMLAASEAAAGIQGLTCNPSERWFNVSAWNKELIEDDDSLLWMEIVSDLIYMQMSFPNAGFNPSITEVLTDCMGYGTGILYSEFVEEIKQMRYQTYPLASCYVSENAYKKIDTLFRVEQYTARQAVELWPDNCPAKIVEMAEKKPESTYTFLHIVMPRKTRNPNALDKLNMKFASYWMWIGGPPNQSGSVSGYAPDGEPEIITEGGYNTFPYQVPRFIRITGETYGRSPAQNVMPDIKTLQTMTRVVLVAAEKIIDPPILIPDDGFVSPFKTVPGSIIKYEASVGGDIRNQVVPLETRGNIGIGTDMMDRYTDRIERAFFIDLFRAQRKKERQSVPEVQDDRGQQMNLLAPIISRFEPEMFGPLVHRTWDCLKRSGMIPKAPRLMRGAKLKLEFTSQAARAQSFGRAMVIPQLLQALTPLAQIDPSVMDVIDTDESARQLADALDVTRKIIRTKRNIGAIRARRQQQQQQTQAAQNGLAMSQAANQLAQAKQTAQTPPPQQ